jgi:hypothetical protein
VQQHIVLELRHWQQVETPVKGSLLAGDHDQAGGVGGGTWEENGGTSPRAHGPAGNMGSTRRSVVNQIQTPGTQNPLLLVCLRGENLRRSKDWSLSLHEKISSNSAPEATNQQRFEKK